MSITLRHLEIFLAVCRCESLSEAAVSLNMSKSAVSQSISDLEERLGVRLFVRAHARMIINAEGRQLRPYADEMILRSSTIKDIFQKSQATKTLVVDCTLSIGSFMLANLLQDFQMRAGWLPSVHIANTQGVADRLLDFTSDIALIEGPVASQDLVTRPWMMDRMVVVAGANHPLANKRIADWADLSEENWILREPGSSTRIFFDTKLSLYLERPKILMTVNSFDSLLGMVRNGMGLTFVTERVLNDPIWKGHLVRIDTHEVFTRQLSFCYHKNKYLSTDVISFMTVCEAWAKRMNPHGFYSHITM